MFISLRTFTRATWNRTASPAHLKVALENWLTSLPRNAKRLNRVYAGSSLLGPQSLARHDPECAAAHSMQHSNATPFLLPGIPASLVRRAHSVDFSALCQPRMQLGLQSLTRTITARSVRLQVRSGYTGDGNFITCSRRQKRLNPQKVECDPVHLRKRDDTVHSFQTS